MKKIISILLLATVLIGCLASCSDIKYNRALSLIEKGEYEKAYAIFEELGDDEMCAKFHYVPVSVKNSTAGGTKYSYEYFEYNENGLLSKITYGDSGICVEFLYDENGNFVREITNNNGVKSFESYFYDENGNMIKTVSIGASDEVRYSEYTYNSDNNKTKSQSFDSEGNPGGKIEWLYDDKGNMVKRIYDANNNYSVMDFTYDEKGNMTGRFDTSDTSNSSYEYVYDDDGKKIKEIFVIEEGKETVTEYLYDDNGNLIKTFEDAYHAMLNDSVEYYYDDNNRLVKRVCKDHIGKPYGTDVWTYDEKGNMIKHSNDNGQIVEYEYKLVYIPYDLEDLYSATREMLSQNLGKNFEYLYQKKLYM
ncbi:MAG: hypothetical protein E7633_08790 [Ruminococcaceae bacterium]|nr:hypothetical protein [Oscillospiraceae bacterium]